MPVACSLPVLIPFATSFLTWAVPCPFRVPFARRGWVYSRADEQTLLYHSPSSSSSTQRASSSSIDSSSRLATTATATTFYYVPSKDGASRHPPLIPTQIGLLFFAPPVSEHCTSKTIMPATAVDITTLLLTCELDLVRPGQSRPQPEYTRRHNHHHAGPDATATFYNDGIISHMTVRCPFLLIPCHPPPLTKHRSAEPSLSGYPNDRACKAQLRIY